jgi:hypothetical protein
LNLQPSGYEPDELPIAPPHDVIVIQCMTIRNKNKTLLHGVPDNSFAVRFQEIKGAVVALDREDHAL